MDLAGLLMFSMTLCLAAAAPGPGVAAIVARVLGRGAAASLPFTAGVAIGDVVWLTIAISGMAVVAHAYPEIFVVIKWAGAGYLLLMAWRMWTAPVSAGEIAAETNRDRPASQFFAGLAVTLANPKVMLFYLALLPTLLDLATISLPGYAALIAATLCVLALVFGAYTMLAQRIRCVFTRPDQMRTMNRGSAVAMAVTAVWMTTK